MRSTIMTTTSASSTTQQPGMPRRLDAVAKAWHLAVLLLAAVASTAPMPAAAGGTDDKAQTAKQAPRGKGFASPQEGMEAFASAVKAHDQAALRAILGPGGEAILNSGDRVADRDTRDRFTTSYTEAHKVDQRDGKAWIVVGKDDWPLPIPLVQQGSQWYFDSNAGKEEVLNRRIGRNELHAIEAVRAYVDAQQEYYSRNPQNDKLLQYAQRFVSSPNKRDGLYFPTKGTEQPSPLGPLFEARAAAGVAQGAGKSAPYHGYHYRILRSQGRNAPGGAYQYVVNGKMIGGFALVAYPATYGNSGVMTFIVNHDGVVYEKDLGPNTPAIVQKMDRFDPDDTWKRH
jgi:hypothetical protein